MREVTPVAADRIKVLITVKTYPLPSESYMELVCTAGVSEDGRFIRLFPVDYRYQPYYKWYRKYQWIEVAVTKNMKDPRPETYRPDMTTLKVLGEPLSTANNWAERKRYVLAQGVSTMCGLQTQSQTQRSLGIIRPKEVVDFRATPADREWKAKWKAEIVQLQLLGPERKPLEKIPYKFSYIYRCEEPGCKSHNMMIEDWEVCELYRAMRDKYRDEAVAVEKVKQKYFTQICAPTIDTHFYVGTVLKHDTWVIIGVFWPKKGGAASR